MRPLIITAFCIIALIIGKFLYSSSNSKDEKGNSKSGMAGGKGNKGPMPVKTIIVGLDNTDKIVFSSGTAVPNEEVELRSETSGKITKLLINEGTNVLKGQLIAKIKDDDIVAQLRKIEIESKLAAQIEARQKKLLEINAISREEFEIASNKVSTLNADKELLLVNLAKTEIRAPFSGKIGLKNISLGAYVSPATVIATLVQVNPIKIDFSVPEKYLDKISPGQHLSFQLDGNDNKYIAKVNAIDPKIDETLRTLKIRAVADNSGSKILPGMFIRVNLNLGSQQAIMIPSETIIPILGGKKVFVKRNGKAEEVLIETGLRNESKVQIVSGLKTGDSLITSALMNLKPGSEVFTKK